MDQLWTFEIQLGWFPGSGWMRAPYYRTTYEAAQKEALQYMDFARRNGQTLSIRVVPCTQDQTPAYHWRIWEPK